MRLAMSLVYFLDCWNSPILPVVSVFNKKTLMAYSFSGRLGCSQQDRKIMHGLWLSYLVVTGEKGQVWWNKKSNLDLCRQVVLFDGITVIILSCRPKLLLFLHSISALSLLFQYFQCNQKFEPFQQHGQNAVWTKSISIFIIFHHSFLVFWWIASWFPLCLSGNEIPRSSLMAFNFCWYKKKFHFRIENESTIGKNRITDNEDV